MIGVNGDAFVLEEMVDVERPIRGIATDACQDVEVHAVLLQQAQPLHHPVEGRAAVTALAIAVVDVAWTIEADADEEIVILEERAPLVGEPQTVGLERVLDLLFRAKGLLHRHDATKEVEPPQRWFAAVPHELDHRCWLGPDVLLGVRGEDSVRHPVVLAAAEQRALLQVEAVVAPDVAHRPHRLGQDVDAGRAR